MTMKDMGPKEPADFDSLSSLLRHALGDELLAPDAGTLLEMMTDDIVFEFPFPLPNGVRRIEGKAAFEAYLPKVGEALDIESLMLDRVLISADGKSVAVEFNCRGCSKINNARYDQTYVSVMDLREGRISRYRDYWNPLVAIAAVGTGDFASEQS